MRIKVRVRVRMGPLVVGLQPRVRVRVTEVRNRVRGFLRLAIG